MKLEYINVEYIYQRNTKFAFSALKNINLKFAPGEITAIIGNSGSGKSTLVQLANGIERPTQGQIIVGDNQWTITHKRFHRIKNIKELRQKVGLVFQFPEYQLFEDTVFKDVTFSLKNYGEHDDKVLKSKAEFYLNMVGLPLTIMDKSPFELSGGQKRRVAIAGILIMEPEILIFDEPTCGLDPEGEFEIMEILRNLQKKHQKTIIFVSHNMNNILEYAKYVCVLYKGQIERYGTPIEIFDDQALMKKTSLIPPRIIQLTQSLEKHMIKFHRQPKTMTELINFCQTWLKQKNVLISKNKTKRHRHE